MERVEIGKNFTDQPTWKIFSGVPLIYIPLIITVPFVIVGIILARMHLKLVGAKNLRSYWSFVPAWITHRYIYKDQIIYKTDKSWASLGSYRFYWIFNCKLYCPLSVALFRYMAYLIQVVENWWCPFEHEKKSEYTESAVDRSFWHLYEKERSMLHPDDRENPIWNEEAQNGADTK